MGIALVCLCEAESQHKLSHPCEGLQGWLRRHRAIQASLRVAMSPDNRALLNHKIKMGGGPKGG